MNWNAFYAEQAGGSYNLNVFRGASYQRGYGLGGSFRSFFRWLVPIFKEHALRLLKSGAQEVGKEAVNSITYIAKDAVNGQNIKEAANEHLSSAMDNLKEKVNKKLSGKGIKRRKKRKNTIIFRKKAKLNNIFDQNEI